jgi:hypothetical protein
MIGLALAIGLAVAVVTNIIAIAIQAPSFRGTAWGLCPEPEHHRSEAPCSWVVDCRPS